MAKSRTQTQQQAPSPGALFRVPGVGARGRVVIDTGPCAANTKKTTSASGTTSLGFGKFNTLDIDRGFLYVATFSSKYTKGTAKTLVQSPLFPANNIRQIQVQYESAYSTFRLPGWLAQIMQGYRSMLSPTFRGSSGFENSANAFPPKALGSKWFATAAKEQTATPTLAATFTGVKQTYTLMFEVPVSMYFDVYWELSATGHPMGPPIPRAIVSPQRMAASTRNVIPRVTAAAGLLSNTLYTAGVSKKSTDATSAAATLSVTSTWFRTAWIPTGTPLTEPPGRMWQYTRDHIDFQPSGAKSPVIPLDADVPGQGQILSLVFGTWTPTLTTTKGNMVAFTKYTTVELLLGSKIQLKQETPFVNAYEWGSQHGQVLPAGIMGWDLALTDDGKLTNENAINTLVEAGAQLKLNYKTFTPSSKATVYVGLEVLKKVGS